MLGNRFLLLQAAPIFIKISHVNDFHWVKLLHFGVALAKSPESLMWLEISFQIYKKEKKNQQ